MIRVIAGALVFVLGGAALAQERGTVAVLEYRAGVRGARDIGMRLARHLRDTAALTVIDGQEARRKLGPRIDADVGRCSGDARCIGALGVELGVKEVLLVGVSQLGDIIVALQRIDSQRGQAGARLAESLPPDREVSDEQVLGWLRELFPPEVFRRYGTIRVEADLAGAEVSLNGELAGKTPLEPLKLRAPARYKLKVDKRGFVPFQARIDLLPDGDIDVRATLVRESAEVPWFKRWYVWAVVGGVVAAGAAGTAIYFGTRVDPTPLGYVQRPALTF